jgi:hypothetical protein
MGGGGSNEPPSRPGNGGFGGGGRGPLKIASYISLLAIAVVFFAMTPAYVASARTAILSGAVSSEEVILGAIYFVMVIVGILYPIRTPFAYASRAYEVLHRYRRSVIEDYCVGVYWTLLGFHTTILLEQFAMLRIAEVLVGLLTAAAVVEGLRLRFIPQSGEDLGELVLYDQFLRSQEANSRGR